MIPLGLLQMPFQFWLKARIPPGPVLYQGNPSLFLLGVELGLTSRRKVVTTDASNSGWATLYEGNLAFDSRSIHDQRLHINCLEMMAVCLALKTFLLALSPLGQHDSGSLYQSPRRCQVTSPVQDDTTSSVLGTKQTPLITSGSCAGQIESGSGYVVQRQCSSREEEVTPSVGSNDLVGLRQGKGGALRSRRQLSLPNLLFETAGCDWPNTCLYAFPPITLIPQVIRRGQGNDMLSPLGSPALEKPDMVSGADSAAFPAAPWPIPLRRDLLSQARGTIWHPQLQLWNLHVCPLDGSLANSPRESPIPF